MPKKKIIDARADKDGDIEAVLFEGNTKFTPLKKAIEIADRKEIENAHAVHPKTPGRKDHLRTNPDRSGIDKQKNLDDMAGDN